MLQNYKALLIPKGHRDVGMKNFNVMISSIVSYYDRDLHARSPSGLETCSPLIRAANCSANDEERVFCEAQNIMLILFKNNMSHLIQWSTRVTAL